MNGAIIRIALRYGAGFLIARGLMGASDAQAISNDPDIEMLLEAGLGVVTGAVTETFYYLAHRFNWSL